MRGVGRALNGRRRQLNLAIRGGSSSLASVSWFSRKEEAMLASSQIRQGKWTRLLGWAVVGWALLACASVTQAAPAGGEEPGFFQRLLENLFNSRGLLETLSRPEYTTLAFVALNLIVFTETGLLIGFFLPGDSLLVTAGVACQLAGWPLPLLLLTLSASAIIGDSVGYGIGWRAGPRIFNREKSLFFKKDHLLKAQDFYERHGGKTIILARFMPIIRTFAPVVAGVARMEYRRFLFFNVIGGIGWVVSMVLIGYKLTEFINPALRPILGEHFDVRDHIEKVVIIVVLLSISPGIFVWLRSKLRGKVEATPELAKAGK
jgi:membrane-associated protein